MQVTENDVIVTSHQADVKQHIYAEELASHSDIHCNDSQFGSSEADDALNIDEEGKIDTDPRVISDFGAPTQG